jgi:hypothetical protein
MCASQSDGLSIVMKLMENHPPLPPVKKIIHSIFFFLVPGLSSRSPFPRHTFFHCRRFLVLNLKLECQPNRTTKALFGSMEFLRNLLLKIDEPSNRIFFALLFRN